MTKRTHFENCEIVREFGIRMRKAREMNCMTLETAARKLGYRNKTKLCKIELSSDTFSIPWYIVPKAVMVYQVSADWLYGLSEDWEVGTKLERQVTLSLEEITKEMLTKLGVKMNLFLARQKQLDNAFRLFSGALGDIEEASTQDANQLLRALDNAGLIRDHVRSILIHNKREMGLCEHGGQSMFKFGREFDHV